MYEVSQAYLSAISSGAPQHIKGTLYFADGSEYELPNDYIEGTPRIEKQCTENADAFMFGEMYVGTVELIIHYSVAVSSRFRGAQIALEFGVDVEGSDAPEYIPLGIWDITSAERLTGEHRWQLKGADRLNRLRTAINDGTVGRIKLANVLDIVRNTADVQFEQTDSEIAALIGRPANSIVCLDFAASCWDEVRQIAQLMGGFAFANRSGKIEFRKFGTASVLTIDADRRFSLKLSEYPFSVDAVSYTDRDGKTYISPSQSGTAVIGFTDNKYIYTDDSAEQYAVWIDPIAENFTQEWYPGTCDYYGDPALDLGDIIVTENLAGTGKTMLITALSWGFRAPQIITSAGFSDSGASSYSSGGSYSGSSQTSAASVLRTVVLETFPDSFEGRYTAAQGGFGVRQPIDGFVNVGITVLADSGVTVGFTVLLDEIAQVLQPSAAAHNGEKISLFAAVPISPSEGSHTVRVEVEGSGTITDISAVVVGQDIAPESPEITSESDYTYTIADGAATITGYIGSSTYPRIPDKLGGASVTAIAAGAFTGTAVKNVYIPEGVEEIQ